MILSEIQLPVLRSKPQTLDSILYKLAYKYNVSPADILRRDRSAKKVFIRYEICREAKKCGFTQNEMAEFLGMDHSSISHLLNKYRPPYRFYLNKSHS